MNFGQALEAIKHGKKASREGWNGKDQYIMLGINIWYNSLQDDQPREFSYHEDIDSKAIVFCGARGKQIGWLASQSDMLAEDWKIVE